MDQRKEVFLSCLICFGILALIVALGRLDLKNEKIEFADDYEDLQISVEYLLGKREVNIWKGEEAYYFFLPSQGDSLVFSFGNLRKEDVLMIGEHTYKQGDEVSENIKFGIVYEMRLFVGGKELPMQQIVFQCSEGLPTVFLETTSGTMDQIHADKTTKEEGFMLLLDETGECGYQGGG